MFHEISVALRPMSHKEHSFKKDHMSIVGARTSWSNVPFIIPELPAPYTT